MHLKRLDIHGFKSFANRTQFDFSPGVTCIVGPNGTGKTNVADSLRWVLGEHSSRSLRARKTEDVIFAGSEKRSALGMAEVSITLDNSSQWMPIDFSEVVVTRRAYRSGDNEYLINGARVRLRDVVDLFQRAEMGQNSYAFMGQGMVEQALSLRPEDRRALIEEAADVRQYRDKLEDARRKLKATRENVERVRLLVREIEPRINQLERQAGRAVKYHELTKELASTLHVWFSHQWRDVNEQLLAAIADHDQRVEECERARADSRACEDGLTQLRAAIEERRREIGAREAELASVQDYVRDLDRRLALDSERRAMLVERVDELAAELTALEEERAAYETAVAIPDHSDVERKLAESRDELARERERLDTLEQDLAGVRRAAVEAEQAAVRARAEAEEASRRLALLADRQAALERAASATGEARAAALADIAAWARRYRDARTADIAARADAEAAEAGRERARQATDIARAELIATEDALRAVQAELQAAQLRFEILETQESPSVAPDAGVRLILEAGGVIRRESVPEDIELSGVLGLLGQLVRVPGNLEKAIEAALAENLFAVVFERQNDMHVAVNLLLDGDAGRATMYALDSFQETRPLQLIKERGVVGVASSLVKCESRYRRLVDTVLGRVVVVESVGMAQRFVRRGIASAVATLDGVLLRPVGSVTVGSHALVEAAFVRQREAGLLPEEVERLRARAAQQESALTVAKERAERAYSRARDADVAYETARTAALDAQAALSGMRSELAPIAARFVEFRARKAGAASERSALEAERDEVQRTHDDRVREALAAEEREQHHRRAIAEMEPSKAEADARVAAIAATVGELEATLRIDYQATRPERVTREGLHRQITSKTEQRERLASEAEQLTARIDANAREQTAKQEQLDALQRDLEPARRELAQFESRERSLSAELVEANARLREADRGRIDAENDVRIRREELETVRVSLEAEGFVTTADGDVEPVPAPEDEPAAQNGGLPGWLRGDAEGGLPPIAGGSTVNPTEVRDRIAELRGQIRALGPVNEQAASDFTETRERYQFLTTQLSDLSDAEAQLLEACDELEVIVRERFRETFKVVNREFERYFNAFFRGGTARLELGETDDEGLPGVEIYAQPPGKKLGSLALLSGGERSLTAVALLFALLSVNPSPICVLDEVDAALDEANVGRFVDELRALSEKTQFVIITHNRRTIETADSIYGVSMGADSVTRVLSLRLADVKVE